jgi:hypothetical protein
MRVACPNLGKHPENNGRVHVAETVDLVQRYRGVLQETQVDSSVEESHVDINT